MLDIQEYITQTVKFESNDTLSKIAEDLGLPTTDIKKVDVKEIDFNNSAVEHPSVDRIFISHSSIDKPIVEKVIDILEAIGVPSNKIFCSSFEGYGVKLGSDFLSTIRDELNDDVLVLFILSENFYTSIICLCEMGATWVKTNHHIPILVPPFEYGDIEGVIPTTHGMKINEKEKLNSLKDRVEELFNIDSIVSNVWERRRNKLLKEIKIILDSNEKKLEIDSVSSDHEIRKVQKFSNRENVKDIIKENSNKEWPDDFDMQLNYIQRQYAAIEKLKKHNPIDISIEDFNTIRAKAQEEWPDDFEMQISQEQKQIESLRRLRDI